MLPVRLFHLFEWEGTRDISVQHKKLRWVASQDRIAKMIDTSCRAECLIFAQIAVRRVSMATRQENLPDIEFGKLCGSIFNKLCKNDIFKKPNDEHSVRSSTLFNAAR